MKRRNFLAAMGIAPVAAPAIAKAVVSGGGNFEQVPSPKVGYGGFGKSVIDSEAHRHWQDMENARLRKLVEDARLRLRVSTKRTLPRIVRAEYSKMDVPDKLNLSARASYRNLSSLRRWKLGYRHFREMADMARMCIDTGGTFGFPRSFAGSLSANSMDPSIGHVAMEAGRRAERNSMRIYDDRV